MPCLSFFVWVILWYYCRLLGWYRHIYRRRVVWSKRRFHVELHSPPPSTLTFHLTTMTVVLRWLMMMAIFIAHGSIDLNAQCAEEDYRFFFKNDRKKSWEDMEKFRCSVSPEDMKKTNQSENRWVFRCPRNVAEESASLIVCSRAFQCLGVELEQALKPSCFLVCFSVALRICRRGLDDERRDRAAIYRSNTRWS